MTSGYSGTPLATKIGITPGARVLLVRAPELPELQVPDAVTLHRRRGAGRYDVVILFAGERAELQAGFAPLIPALTTPGALWACWPKRASGVATDLDENAVRAHGLATGLVDVKIAAIDATWRGLKFVRRRIDR